MHSDLSLYDKSEFLAWMAGQGASQGQAISIRLG
jgi:hypothetical protein